MRDICRPSLCTTVPTLILASTSVYRQQLLARLGLPFHVVAPHTDETPRPGEPPCDVAWRLAQAKAAAVAHVWPQTDDDIIVIGSDQVAELDGTPFGKPGTHDRAVAQLRMMRGRCVRFHTAVSVLRPQSGFSVCDINSVAVTFRELSDADIDAYLRLEEPYDCAGSAKCEGLGISLLESIHSDDPTALIGLPLILTTRLLRLAGLDVLTALSHTNPTDA
jgi:septum formation protein